MSSSETRADPNSRVDLRIVIRNERIPGLLGANENESYNGATNPQQ